MTPKQLFAALSGSPQDYCVIKGYHSLPVVNGPIYILCRDPADLKQRLNLDNRERTSKCCVSVEGLEFALIPSGEMFMPGKFESQILRKRVKSNSVEGLYTPSITEAWLISLFWLTYIDRPEDMTLEQFISFRELIEDKMGVVVNPKLGEFHRESVDLKSFKVAS